MNLTLQKIESLLTNRNYGERTQKNYLYWTKKLIQYHEIDNLNDYKCQDIIDFLLHLKRRNSHNTTRIAIAAMNFTFNNVGKLGYDFSSVQKGKVKNTERIIVSQSSIIKLIDTCSNLKYKLAFSLLYGTGMTLTELLNIKIIDINIINKTIVLKSNKRLVTIPEKLIDEMNTFIGNSEPQEWLFHGKNNNKNETSSFRKQIKLLSRNLNLVPAIQLKDLRNAYVKHLEATGVSIHSILDELGMSNKDFARNYSINHYANIRDTSERVEYSPLDKHIINKKDVQKTAPYISLKRINEIEQINSKDYDFSKVIKILKEVNIAYENGMYFSIGMLLRAFIDHIPPLFGYDSFNSVANNYKGTKSFKKLMKKLQDSLRNISDSFLHEQIRKSENLPNSHQINFISELDALLSEVIRINKKPAK